MPDGGEQIGLGRAPVNAQDAELAALAVALGARNVSGWSPQECALAGTLPAASTAVATATDAIRRGEDPLGETFCRLSSPAERRPLGATYTPASIVSAMLAWAAEHVCPARVIDPGAGSARFLVAAGRRFPNARLVAVEVDPLAAILARGHLAAAGFAARSTVIVGDYRELTLPPVAGPTLFLGNPPYVRHHLPEREWKTWLVKTARLYGLAASQLAGLHAYFFLATANYGRPGDVGVLISAGEWLDVNYGQLIRELLLGVLGVKTIQVIEPTAAPFPGVATSAVITGFEVGSRPPLIGMRRVSALPDLGSLPSALQLRRELLETARRWTPLTRTAPTKPAGYVELGELCRVHRGQVTGANRIWIAGLHAAELPAAVLFPTVTKARELFAAAGALTDAAGLRQVIDLPPDLDSFNQDERGRIDRFLRLAKSLGADTGFVAQHRKAWWAVGLREPAPILATYMARRPPAFVLNAVNARHINIAHGLYPRDALTPAALHALAVYLSSSVTIAHGRMYAGGLTKFEPKEMERLLVPRPELMTSQQSLEFRV